MSGVTAEELLMAADVLQRWSPDMTDVASDLRGDAKVLDGVEDIAKTIYREYELAVRGDGKFQPWELAEFNQYKFLAGARALWADGWRKA